MRILAQLPKINELPTLPEIMVKVQGHINSDKASVDKLADIIKQDPALSSTILKTANSAFYNIINRRLSSVKESITRIGFNEVLKITLGMSVIKQFSNTGGVIDYRKFWRHSLAAAGITLVVADIVKEEYSSEDRQNLYLAGLLHDIGKLYIPLEIVQKSEKFTEDEMALLKQHPVIAEKILCHLGFLQGVLPIIRHHHEAFDGNGYPDGLKGDKIPYGAKALSLMDSFDAMTSPRPQRKALSTAAYRRPEMLESDATSSRATPRSVPFCDEATLIAARRPSR